MLHTTGEGVGKTVREETALIEKHRPPQLCNSSSDEYGVQNTSKKFKMKFLLESIRR
jgi:hypothetical protein